MLFDGSGELGRGELSVLWSLGGGGLIMTLDFFDAEVGIDYRGVILFYLFDWRNCFTADCGSLFLFFMGIFPGEAQMVCCNFLCH